MLLRHRSGERVWSVLREPTAEQDDARRHDRELARVSKERTQHTSRIGSLLVLHNLRPHTERCRRKWLDLGIHIEAILFHSAVR